MKRILLILISIYLTACDGGLNPEIDRNAYIEGKIIFVSPRDKFPPPDSLKDLRVVCFKDYPPNNIIEDVLTGKAYFTETALNYDKDTVPFQIKIIDPPTELKYIVAAQNYGTLLQWRAIGVYHINQDTITSINVQTGKKYEIEIRVDWDKIPYQPFGL